MKLSSILVLKNSNLLMATYVLVRFEFMPSIITITIPISYKVVIQMKKLLRQEQDKKIVTPQRKDRLIYPSTILNNRRTYLGYNILMSLYIRFHQSDPNLCIDIEAILKAWILYNKISCSLDEITINRFWNLCHYMMIENLFDKRDDGGRMFFSKEFQAFQYQSNFCDLDSCQESNRHGYNYYKLKPINEILNNLKK